jgi:hypothetical protein
MRTPFNFSNESISVFVIDKMYTVDNTHPNYEALIEELKKEDHDLEQIGLLASIKNFIQGLAFGHVIVAEDQVYYKNKPIDDYLSRKMLQILRDGFDITMWVKFVDNLMLNPVDSAKEELYKFLESSNLPLTDDGCFLAFKKVREDYTSYHSYNGKVFDHHVGEHVEEDEENVDRNRNKTCSGGLHFCSKEYLPHYYGGEGRVVVVKINPADVRAIPSDYDNAKGRALQYDVVSELAEEQAAEAFDGSSGVEGYIEVGCEDTSEDEYDNYCPECGEEWSNSGNECDSCDWDEDGDTITISIVFEDDDDSDADDTSTPEATFGPFNWTRAQMQELIKKHGSKAAVARAKGVAISTFKDWVYASQK